MKHLLFFISALLLPSLLSAQEAHTHADGTTHAAHGDEAANSAVQPGADHFTVYGESDKYELTLYYPELVAGQEAHLTLFVADVRTNRPIEKAAFQVSTLENPQIAFEVQPLSPGVVRDGTLPKQGFLKQEDISLDAFLATKTGRLYA